MTAHAVYVCHQCAWVSAPNGNKAEETREQESRDHATATGHTVVIQRVKMPWEVG